MDQKDEDRSDAAAPAILAGGGEMGRRIRTFDWSQTPLGPVAEWSQSLQTAVGIMLRASTPLGIYWGADLILLYNDAWRSLIGDKHPGALGRPAQQVFPEIWETVGPALLGVLASGAAVEAKGQRLPLRRNGRLEDAWFDYSFNPVPLADGTTGGVFNIATEVTGRVHAEEARQVSAERLQVASSAAMLGAYARDLVTGEDFWSPEFLAIYGLGPDEQLPLQDGIPAAVHPADRERVLAEARARLERTITPRFSSEHRIIRADGQVRWVLIHGQATFDAQGQPLVVQGIVMDITERQQAEEALRESERRQRALAQSLEAERTRLATILENLPVGVWIADKEGQIIGKNEQADRIWVGDAPLLKSIDEYIRYDAWRAADGKKLLPDEYPVARVVQTGQQVEPIELQIRRFDGSEGTVLVSAAPIRDSHGNFQGVVGINVDITGRKQAEEQLFAINESLEQRVEERTRQVQELATQLTLAEHEERSRVAQILHDDLQQQLYALQLRLMLLRNKVEQVGDERLLEEFSGMAQSLAAALETTRRLSVDMSPAILEGEGLAESIGWLVSQMESRYGLAVKLEATGSFPVREQGRRVLLFRTVRELLFNAVKYAGVERVTVSLQQVDGLYRIEVTDEGAGFNPDVVLGEDSSHIGRGLLYGRERLKLIGGHLEVESAPGAGTRIIITVPPEEE